ncbi:MAG: multifunctional CCA addition/repair protein [Pseudomonadota bacterium]
MKVYLVGGAVRDMLLKQPVKDKDYVVVGATVQQMLELGFQRVGRDFPVFLHPQTKEEYALARTERKSGHGYTGFEFHADPGVTLEQDLQRRDLTINAMAMDANGALIDPYGGERDLRMGVLRHVSEAFREDPVRLLRVARFAARFAGMAFEIHSGTRVLMRTMVEQGEVDYLVPERVWAETARALAGPSPQRFFEVLQECGAMEVLFPEIAALHGVPQPGVHHPEIDTGVHTMLALRQAALLSDDPRVRFAVLLHDLGKGRTDPGMWPCHHGHESRGVALVDTFCQRLKVPSDYADLARLVTRYHGHYRRVSGELTAATIVKTLEALDAFRRPERFERFLLACEADLRGRTGREDAPLPHRRHFQRLHEAAGRVSVDQIRADGFAGREIRDELHRRRVSVVKMLLGEIRQ